MRLLVNVAPWYLYNICQPTQNWNGLEESYYLIQCILIGFDAMWFLPSALNVTVKEFNQARANGGSNYDSIQVTNYLAI